MTLRISDTSLQVDLVFSGHVHSYARTCNVLAGKCVDMRQGGCGIFSLKAHSRVFFAKDPLQT